MKTGKKTKRVVRHSQGDELPNDLGESKRIVIAGYFGFDNAGDDAILSVMLDDIAKARPHDECVIVSGNPEAIVRDHNVRAVAYNDIQKIIDEIERSDLVILGGGGLFQDYWGFDLASVLTSDYENIGFYSTFPILATLFRKPLMLHAIGVGPLFSETSRYYTRMAFEQSWTATVRDPESRDLLVSMGLDSEKVRVTADPAFRFQAAGNEEIRNLLETNRESSSDGPIVGVSLRNWTIGTNIERWSREVAHALDQFAELHSARFLFVPFQATGSHLTDDFNVSKTVRDQMHAKEQVTIIEDARTVKEKAAVLARCDLILGMRLHSLIFAANAYVPMVGLVYDPKVRNVMKQLGLSDYAIDLGTLYANDLAGLMSRALADRKRIAGNLRRAHKKLADQAKLNSDLLTRLLEAPEGLEPLHAPETQEFLRKATIQLARRAEKQKQALRRSESVFTEQVSQNKSAIESLNARLEEKQQDIESLTSEAAARAGAAEVLTEQSARQQEVIESLTSQVALLQSTIQTLTARTDELKENTETLTTHLLEKEREVGRLEAQLDQKDKTVSALREQIAERDARVQSTVRSLTSRTSELEQNLESLTIQLSQKKHEVEGLEAQLDHKDKTVSALRERIAERDILFQSTVRSLTERTDELKENTKTLTTHLLEKEREAGRLEAQLDQKDKTDSALREQMAETDALFQSTVRSLTSRTSELEQNLESSIIQLSQKKHEVEGLETQLDHNDKTVSALREQMAESDALFQSTVRSLTSRTSELEQYVESFTSHLSQKNQEVEGLEAQLDDVSALQAELDEKEKTLSALQAQIAERQHTISALKAHIAQNEHTIVSLNAQRERMTSTIGWRLLNYYGRIKYRYLLPVYRLLGLPPFHEKKSNDYPIYPQMPNQSPEPEQVKQTKSAPIPESEYRAPGLVAIGEGREDVSNGSNAYDVVCFPIIDWSFRFQRPQQLMSQFAAAGHRVFYISQTFRSSGAAYTIEEKNRNIYEVSLRGPQRSVYADVLDDRGRDELFDSLNTFRRELSLGATAAFVQLPFWWPLASHARAKFAWPIIYDCMDHHAGFSTNRKQMLDQEDDLLASADLVIVSSAFLESEARHHNSNVLVVRNACDYEHFAKAGHIRHDRPVIGYYGAIADWFDSDLVADLAEQRPDWEFVLVGSTFSADTDRLSKLPNIALEGERPYSEIPDWLTKFDVAIIPFKRIPLTEATNPVKAYEILASGKPLVSVPIPEMASLAPLVRLASSAEEFEREISGALREDEPDLIEGRRAFAREHTWRKRYEALSPAIRDVFPKASIIVVTFSNLALNRLCLESLYARTEWPNFEVIVVDNASVDDTPGYLKRAGEYFPNLSVILNETNLGFAAANNIGLKQAAGEYLILLNNDTVLSRGWLSALIRHMHSNSEIGLIGPVTNAIGNDAKVEVGYEELDEMPLWAENFIRENDGKTFSIPMVAMFCVAMRREVFEKVGLLDERFGIGMFEDDDYNTRVRDQGYEIRCASDSFVHHWQKSSFNLLGEEEYLRLFEENRKKFEQKWGEKWKAEGVSIWKRSDLGFYRDQLEEVIKRVRESKGAVIFLPSVGWNIHLFQRPHHLSRVFAQQGYISIFDGSNAQDDVNGFKEIEPNLFLFRGPVDLLHEIPNPILWAFPYNFDQKDGYPARVRTVYDWIDDLEVFPFEYDFLKRNHERALKEATIVASVARRLHEEALVARPDALYLPNGVEVEHFTNHSGPLPNDQGIERFRREGKPIAGYYGALAKWFDYELLDQVALLRPDWNFLLIGPMYDDSLDGRPILTRSNVAWIGPRDYRMLPAYLRMFDVATIPFVINNITQATSPLKLYEYFAGGKPVVTTPMSECRAFPQVNIVQDAEEFSNALDAARQQGLNGEFCESLRALARENSWTARVQTVLEHLEHKTEVDNKAIQQSQPVELKSISPPETQSLIGQPLVGAAAEVAERFRHFRTPQNRAFFDALAVHLYSIASDPCLPMYFEFAITCNDRGRKVANLLRRYTTLCGKRFFDVGCAYGGFLVAFIEQGAEVVGIDTDEALLKLAGYNMTDNGLDVPLLARDATQATDLLEFCDSFDIITCNDVIEHVEDPQALVHNIGALLRSDGIAYFEIPNRYNPRSVLQDGHYQLFGITLLDCPEASEYYSLHAPGTQYGVRHYLEINQYAKMFELEGLQFMVLDESFDNVNISTILNDIAELRAYASTGLNKVPSALRKRVGECLTRYLHEADNSPRATASEQRDFILRYGAGFWRVLARKIDSERRETFRSDSIGTHGQLGSSSSTYHETSRDTPRAQGTEILSHHGRCNICGNQTTFSYTDKALYRESLTCGHCLSTSRYRSIARGILRAILELTGVEAMSLAELRTVVEHISLRIYDTQTALYHETNAYPIPDLLSKLKWINVHTSAYQPQKPLGMKLGADTTNQNLEQLTFPDDTFDIVITSDVMEHVRLDDIAHREIRRVLKPGGVYLFTVPHFRDRHKTFFRVAVTDSSDPTKDVYLTEREYHGDANSENGRALSYRSYGTDLDETLTKLGFAVDYCKEDFPELGIMNTELFFCRLSK